MNNNIEMIRLELLETREPFSTIFPVQQDVAELITARMKKSGFDPAHPICVWHTDKLIVLDGHTRMQVARTLGIPEVPVIKKEFKDVAAALDYAVAQQVARRNLTLYEMVQYIEVADELAKRGPKSSEPNGSKLESQGKSSERLGKILHIPTKRAERLRRVVKDGSAEIRKAMCAGEISLSKAYNETLAQKAAKEALQDAQDATSTGIAEVVPSSTQSTEEAPVLQEKSRVDSAAKRMEVIPNRLGKAIEKVVRYELACHPNCHYTGEQINTMREIVLKMLDLSLSQLAITQTEGEK